MKWLPSLIALITAGVSIYEEQIRAFVSAHSEASIIIGAVAVILSHIAPSPLATVTNSKS